MKKGLRRVASPKADHHAGFTLLELLISVTIIGLMIFILVAVLRLGYRSVEAGERKMDSLERLRASFHLIEAQFHSEIPMTYEENGERRFYFEGQPDRLTFSTLFSIWEGEQGVVVVSYRISEEGGGKKALWAEEKRVGLQEGREIKLFDSLADASFAYFSQSPTDETGQWIEQWNDTASLPQKIRLNLVKDGKDLSLLLPVKTPPGRTTGSVLSPPGEWRSTP